MKKDLESKLKKIKKGSGRKKKNLNRVVNLIPQTDRVVISNFNLSENAKIEKLKINCLYIENCNIDNLTFEECEIRIITFSKCNINEIEFYKSSNNFNKIEVFNCNIESFTIFENLYDLICEIRNSYIDRLSIGNKHVYTHSTIINSLILNIHSDFYCRECLINAFYCNGKIRETYNSYIKFISIRNVHDLIINIPFFTLSEELVQLCMAYDAQNHPNPDKFDEWGNGGPCPYENVSLNRISFHENRNLWKPELKNIKINIPEFIAKLYLTHKTELIW